jgi:hypothetical protein
MMLSVIQTKVNRMNKTAVAIALSVGLSGCASNYAKFYEPERVVPATAIIKKGQSNPKIEYQKADGSGYEYQQIEESYKAQGYIKIGKSDFYAPAGAAENLVYEHARAIGADLAVIFEPVFQDVQQVVRPGAIPIMFGTGLNFIGTYNTTSYERYHHHVSYFVGSSKQ